MRRHRDYTPFRAGWALYEEAQIEMIEAKRLTPVRYGHLRDSGFVQPPTFSGRKIAVALSFGNASVDYAWYVHEDPDALHRVGQWKFLEEPVRASAPHMAGRVAARMGRAI
jgi:hypothetical protein